MKFYTPVYDKPKIVLTCFIIFILAPDKELLKATTSQSNKDQRCLHPKPVKISKTLSDTKLESGAHKL